MLFGDYLRHILGREGITPVDLAGYLEIDVSLVYRWLRHERVPGINTNYASRIAAYLNLGPSALNDMHSAQAHSLSTTRQVRRGRALSAHVDDSRGGQDRPAAMTTAPAIRQQYTPIAEFPRVIAGRQQIFDALLALLGQLPVPIPPRDHLALTFLGEDATVGDRMLQSDWRYTLRRALVAGWTIDHYVRLGGEPQRAARLAEDLLVLLARHGRYHPLILAERELLRPPFDLVVGPPDVGALLLLATEQGQHHDTALTMQHPKQVEQLQEYLRQLGATARPLVRAFSVTDRSEYWRALTQVEERPGQRGIFKEGLSVLTRPSAWYAADATWWKRHGHSPDSAALWRRRVAAFERHLRSRHGGYRHRDILPQEALERYVTSGIHLSDLRADGSAVPDSEVERLEHLDRILDLLRAEHYELALVGELAHRGMGDIFWEVKEGQATLLQVYANGTSETGRRIDYIIDEPLVVSGFMAVFEQRWGELAPHERDKQTVRQILEAKRDTLRRVVRQAATR